MALSGRYVSLGLLFASALIACGDDTSATTEGSGGASSSGVTSGSPASGSTGTPSTHASSGASSDGGGGNGTGANGTGGDPSGTGGDPSGTGGDPSGTGGDPSGTGGDPSGTGGDPSGTGGDPSGTGGSGTGGDPSGTGGNGTGGEGGSDPCADDCFAVGNDCNPGKACNVGGDGCGVCECDDPNPIVTSLDSLYIRDPAVLENPALSFTNTLQAIIDSADASDNMTPRDLYIAWFDTNNDDGSAVAGGIHCQDTLNGFPLDCPREEGVLAQRAADFETDPDADPLGPDHYKLVAVVARVDKIPTDGSNCGQYRFSYGLKDAEAPADPDDPDFNYIIFEGVLPNPTPGLGVAGCLPVAQYVVALDQAVDADERAELIRGFFFDGLDGFAPVIDWSHYRGEPSSSGQLRTNQFLISVADQPWQAREYYLDRTGSSSADYELIVTPQTVKENAYGRFFSTAGGGAQTGEFQDWFVDEAVELLEGADDINDLVFPVPPQFNSGQSTQPGFILGLPEEDLVGNYIQQLEGNTALIQRIQDKLDEVGSDLTPENIVARAEQQTCAGCHSISGASSDLHRLGGAIEEATDGPNGENGDYGGYFGTGALGFVHTQSDIAFDGGYAMSSALSEQFLPHRKQILESFIADVCAEQDDFIGAAPSASIPLPRGLKRAIGGGLAHGH